MRPALKLTGLRFGCLSVLRRHPVSTKDKKTTWVCICNCGNEVIITSGNLKSGRSTTCGCSEGKSYRQRFNEAYVIEPNTGCWLWLLASDKDGYGQFFAPEKIRAHRYSYAIGNGPIPKGLLVLHKCDTPSCVNPEHLWTGTNQDNMKDRGAKNRASRHGCRGNIRGEINGSAKLNENKVREIREEYKSNLYTNPELAKKYGVRTSTIWNVVTGKTWVHLL